MERKKFTVSIRLDTYRSLAVYAAQNDTKLPELVQRIFDDFLQSAVNKDNCSVS